MLASWSTCSRPHRRQNRQFCAIATRFDLAQFGSRRSASGARLIWSYNISGRGARRMLRSHLLSTPNQKKRDVMARKLTKNNAHFRRAVKRLPLGVASNFRYWGEDRTIYVKRGVGARITDLDDNE